MRKVVLAILAVMVLLPILEWMVLVQMARAVTWWGVLASLAVAAIAGLALVRRCGPAAWRQAKANRTPTTLDEPELLGMPQASASGAFERSTADRVLLTAAGLLLVFPGVLSDVIGIALLIPVVRARVLDTLLPRLAQRAQRAMLRSMGLDDEMAGVFVSGGAFGPGSGGPNAGADGPFGPGFKSGSSGQAGGPLRSNPHGAPPGSGEVIDI